MKKWSVILTVDATIRVVVEAETYDEAKENALNEAHPPSVCHHCSRELDVGDILEAIEATEIES